MPLQVAAHLTQKLLAEREALLKHRSKYAQLRSHQWREWTSPAPATTTEITLEAISIRAFAIVMFITHGQSERAYFKYGVPVTDIVSVAQIVDDLQCQSVMRMHIQNWITGFTGVISNPHLQKPLPAHAIWLAFVAHKLELLLSPFHIDGILGRGGVLIAVPGRLKPDMLAPGALPRSRALSRGYLPQKPNWRKSFDSTGAFSERLKAQQDDNTAEPDPELGKCDLPAFHEKPYGLEKEWIGHISAMEHTLNGSCFFLEMLISTTVDAERFKYLDPKRCEHITMKTVNGDSEPGCRYQMPGQEPVETPAYLLNMKESARQKLTHEEFDEAQAVAKSHVPRDPPPSPLRTSVCNMIDRFDFKQKQPVNIAWKTQTSLLEDGDIYSAKNGHALNPIVGRYEHRQQ
ncbi:hypothetical protein Micbo1qcDRAFT_173387 [Microdochium bolleyi]|uniref:Uncharacterized protein n=1 Tax=Microdochium bolleyi TaxID=196109 RepID=A0A136JBT1_9PEZI|nr:hypothetical protein Micbo1qcDRAFT_173387 [Microdochium bolleyi]